MRIVFAGGGTGGHLYPGLAIANAVRAIEPSTECFFIGAERGIERDILPESGFNFLLLDLHPLYRARPWENWRTLAGLARAYGAIGREFARAMPALVVGTGGYASGAALGYASTRGIPLALQEQNGEPGITTRFFAPQARAVFLGVPEAAQRMRFQDASVARDTGNPITPPPEPRPDRAAARRAWGFPERDGFALLVFGGSQGARGVNEAMAGWIARGLPPFVHIIWGTGRAAHERYAPLARPGLMIRPYLSPIADAYAAADLAFTRAGALTLAELCAWGIPSVLVPLPTAAADHQTANARALERAGGAVVIPEALLTVETLDSTMRALLSDAPRLRALAAGALARARPHAAREIAMQVLALARESRIP